MIAVTGGGSGGHFYPGLSAARALQTRGHLVVYVGAQEGLEAELLPHTGLPFHLLPTFKLSLSAPAQALKRLPKLMASLQKAARLLRELRPKVVLSTGGYAGFPLAWVAERSGIPVVLHEQNAKLGLASRLLAPRAARLGLSLPVRLAPSLASRSRVVGLPIREERYIKEEARSRMGLCPERPLILVLGGSQGSQELNQKLPERLTPLLDRYQVLHQTGPRWIDQMGSLERPGYHLVGYLETPLAWSAADLAITRAGASTLAEAAFHQVPLLPIPLPPSLDRGAQAANAAFYIEQGAAARFCGWERFEASIAPLLDPQEHAKMKTALAALSPQGAAERLADLVEEAL